MHAAVTHATARTAATGEGPVMSRPHVAIVARDPAARTSAAAAFQGAPSHWSVTLHEDPVAADVIVCEPGMGCDGAVVFDPASPERTLADVARRLVPTVHVQVVTGAGGGVGATTLALHLSAAAAAVRSTCFVDLDTTWGAAARFGLERAEVKTWADAGTEEEDLRLAALPLRGGFRALLAPAGRSIPGDLLPRVGAIFDGLVVDAPVGALASALVSATAVVVVVAATRPGVKRAGEVLERIGDLPTAIVLNRAWGGGAVTANQASDLLGRRVAVELPATPSLRDAEDEGHVLEGPWSRYTRRVGTLARALERA